MKTFKAVEYRMSELGLKETGTFLIFQAEDLERAVTSCLYAARLKNAKAFVGPTGCVVHQGNGTAYSIVEE